MKKRILIMTCGLARCGGIETALVNMLNHIDYDKYSVDVYVGIVPF